MTLKRLDWSLSICLIFLGLLGTWVPLFDLDEGAFLEATRELIDGGHWAATTLDGEPRYDKPILSYWFKAIALLSFDWFGSLVPIEMIGRIPSVLAGVIWALVLGRFTSEQTGKPALGLFVALALASSLGISVISRAATADALLNLWFALLFVDIARYIKAPSDALRLRVFIWFAAGVLTKGPVAILIPAGAFAIWILLSNQWPLLWKAVGSIKAWLVFLSLLTPWLIGVWDAQGFAFFQNFIITHNIERFTGNLHGHGGHPLYYLVVTPLLLLPYSALLLRIIYLSPLLWRCNVARFGLIWIGLVIFLVSLSGTQLPHYVIYSTAPIFFFYARLLPDLDSRIWALPGLLLPLGLICIGLLHTYIQVPIHPRDAEQVTYLIQILKQWWWPLNLAVLSALLLALVVLIIPRWMLAKRLLAMGGIQLAIITLIILPILSEARQAPLKEAALIAKQSNAEVVSQGIRMPSFSFYRNDITKEIRPQPGQWVLISITRFHELAERHRSLEIKAAGPGWRLVAIHESGTI